MPSCLSLTIRNVERGQARRDLHLHVDRAGLDPLKSHRGNPLDHAAPFSRESLAESGAAGKNITGTTAFGARWGTSAISGATDWIGH
jgi:hypothetical protein